MYCLTVTEEHILEGDQSNPSLHPLALAAKPLFPKDVPEIRHVPMYGWAIEIGVLLTKLCLGFSHLCDDLDRIDVPWHSWRVGGVDEKTWRVWVWECWKDELLIQTLPHFADWLVECHQCRDVYEQEDMDAADTCRFCSARNR